MLFSDVSAAPFARGIYFVALMHLNLHCHSTQPLREHWRDVEPGVERGQRGVFIFHVGCPYYNNGDGKEVGAEDAVEENVEGREAVVGWRFAGC